MAKELFEAFNRKQMDEYKEETGVDIPNIESLRSPVSS